MAKEISFPYLQQNKNATPSIPIVIKHMDKWVNLVSIVDSGADYCMFPSEVAEQLGIPYLRAPTMKIYGIVSSVTAYICNADIQILDEFIPNVQVLFVQNFKSVLLGRAGIFNKHIITFDEANSEVKIKSNE